MAYYLLLFVTGQEERVPDSLSFHQERDYYVPVWSYIFLRKEVVWRYIYFVITAKITLFKSFKIVTFLFHQLQYIWRIPPTLILIVLKFLKDSSPNSSLCCQNHKGENKGSLMVYLVKRFIAELESSSCNVFEPDLKHSCINTTGQLQPFDTTTKTAALTRQDSSLRLGSISDYWLWTRLLNDSA